MAELAVEARDLTKVFPGEVVAVSGLDLAIERGTVYGLIGRNGAGKTTTLRMLMGLLRPSAGSAHVLGENLWTSSREHRSRVAYVSQRQQLHAWMTVEELSLYCAHFYDAWDADYAWELAGKFGLAWGRQVGVMSGGEQRKAAILIALAARPEVLILDEPAAGLDPIARRELIDELVEVLSRGGDTTVLFSTHIISDIERIAEHVGIMDRGRLVTSSRLDDLQSSSKRVQVIFPGAAPPEGFRVPGAVKTDTSGPVVNAVVRLESETQLDEVRELPGVRVNVFPLGLEDIFIEIFGPESRGELEGDEGYEPEYLPARAPSGMPWWAWLLVGLGIVLFLGFLMMAG
jgi:ABC-2 type transport system ATP-binding protein